MTTDATTDATNDAKTAADEKTPAGEIPQPVHGTTVAGVLAPRVAPVLAPRVLDAYRQLLAEQAGEGDMRQVRVT